MEDPELKSAFEAQRTAAEREEAAAKDLARSINFVKQPEYQTGKRSGSFMLAPRAWADEQELLKDADADAAKGEDHIDADVPASRKFSLLDVLKAKFKRSPSSIVKGLSLALAG